MSFSKLFVKQLLVPKKKGENLHVKFIDVAAEFKTF